MPDDRKIVLAIFAHPDDESLACGGTLARLADAGVRVVLMCGSRGESGSISNPALVPDGDLGRVRTSELGRAAEILGITDLLVMNHPDGELRWDDVPEFHAEIVSAIERYRPNAVITFAEDGLYWHLDHIGVHERTYTAIKAFGAEAPPLYYVTMPQGIMRELVAAVDAKRGAPLGSSVWGIEPDAFGDAALPPTLAIDVRGWTRRKLAALRCHQTQMGPDNPIAFIDEDVAQRWLGIEYFRRSPLDSATAESVLEQLGAPFVHAS